VEIDFNLKKIVDTAYIAFKYAYNNDLNILDHLASNTLWVGEGTHHYSVRKERFPEYKSERVKDSEYYKKALDFWKLLVSTYGLSVVKEAGYEADDICALEAIKANRANQLVALFGGDKDYLQLPKDIFLYDAQFTDLRAKKRSLQGGKDLVEYVLDNTALFPAYLAMLGDKSDGIPRVLGYRKSGKRLLPILKSDTPYQNLYDEYGNDFLRNLTLVVLPHHTLARIPENDLIEYLDKGNYYDAF
jgi:5'-3' exonuclease